MSETRDTGGSPTPGATSGAGVHGTIAARIDRLPITRTHRRATVAVGLGLFFDIYEVLLTPVLSTVLKTQFTLSAADWSLSTTDPQPRCTDVT
jgi:hypothetical protein